MKVFAFTDFHASKKCLKNIKKQAKGAELLVCGGDVSVFEHGLEESLVELNSIGKPCIIIHGNHEGGDIMEMLCEELDNLFFIHEGVLIYEDLVFLGYGGGGFATRDKHFEALIEKMEKEVPDGKKGILLVHQPPYGTAVDVVYGDEHVGSKSFTDYLKKTKKVSLCLCGHIHEGFGLKDRIGDVEVINPGDMGMMLDL